MGVVPDAHVLVSLSVSGGELDLLVDPAGGDDLVDVPLADEAGHDETGGKRDVFHQATSSLSAIDMVAASRNFCSVSSMV